MPCGIEDMSNHCNVWRFAIAANQTVFDRLEYVAKRCYSSQAVPPRAYDCSLDTSLKPSLPMDLAEDAGSGIGR